MKEDNSEKILYYKFSDSDEMWIYANQSNVDEEKKFNYHILTLIDNIPEIEDIESPLNMLKNIEKNPKVIDDGSLDYIRFIAIKDVAKKKIVNQFKK